MKHTKRVFIGIRFPEEIQEEIQRCQIGIPTARWIKKENLHITLQFIGEISLEELKQLRHILIMVKQNKFKIYLSNPNVFYKKYQKILWLKAEPEEPIILLRNQILNIIRNASPDWDWPFLKKKDKSFVPHTTIARMNQIHQRKLNEYLLSFEDFSTREFEIDSFVLFSSILHPDGAIYHIEQIYQLE